MYTRPSKKVSWECTHCGLPNVSSALFGLSLFETSNTYESLRQDQADYDISFNCPQATSSPKPTWENNWCNSQNLQDGSFSDATASGTVEGFTRCIPARILRECADDIAPILTAIFTKV